MSYISKEWEEKQKKKKAEELRLMKEHLNPMIDTDQGGQGEIL